MFVQKVQPTLIAVVAIVMTLVMTARAQPPVTSRDHDPVVIAIKKIELAVERRAAIAERVLVASKLVNESTAARKQGELERAVAQLQQAEAMVAEIEQLERSYLLNELASSIAVERAALSASQPAVQTPPSSDARKVGAFKIPAIARYKVYRESLTRI